MSLLEGVLSRLEELLLLGLVLFVEEYKLFLLLHKLLLLSEKTRVYLSLSVSRWDSNLLSGIGYWGSHGL